MKFYDANGLDHDTELLKCIRCGKHPRDLPCYTAMTGNAELNATYVMEEEGTLGMKGPNTFYCDDCYIAAGQPLWAENVR